MQLGGFLSITAALALVGTARSQELSRGEIAFRAHCIGCHSIACNRSGPKLQEIFGRKAGSIADFKSYTRALKESGIVWSEESLDAFLRDPGKLVPGSAMAYVVRVERSDERSELIKYLRRQDRSIDLCG
jgi:cytochrome c